MVISHRIPVLDFLEKIRWKVLSVAVQTSLFLKGITPPVPPTVRTAFPALLKLHVFLWKAPDILPRW